MLCVAQPVLNTCNTDDFIINEIKCSALDFELYVEVRLVSYTAGGQRQMVDNENIYQ